MKQSTGNSTKIVAYVKTVVQTCRGHRAISCPSQRMIKLVCHWRSDPEPTPRTDRKRPIIPANTPFTNHKSRLGTSSDVKNEQPASYGRTSFHRNRSIQVCPHTFKLPCRVAVIAALICWGTFAHSADAASPRWKLSSKTNIQFASVTEASKILTDVDEFVQAMSEFDRRIRLQSAAAVSPETYSKFVGTQALAWTQSEIELITASLERTQARLQPFAAWLPPQIDFVKTTGQEESNAPHCRANAVILPRATLESSPNMLDKILIHELFHILSRQPSTPRAKIYAIIGFELCKPIQLPPPWNARKITNPDAPLINCVLTIQQDSQTLHLAPVLYCREENYESLDGRTIFGELEFRLVEVGRNNGEWRVQSPSAPSFIRHDELPGFGERVGQNTRYILHPEEIMADNFVHLVLGHTDLPDPWIVEQLDALLRDKGPAPSP